MAVPGKFRDWLLSDDDGLDDCSAAEPEFVSFLAYRVPEAKVLWLNERWLFEHGIDARDAGTLERVRQKFLAHYACAVVDHTVDPARIDLSRPVALWADRYGETGGATHGGSGRTGTRGPFNAKGIGRTPLVSRNTDWYHAHGCMWLEEAIREAIIGETLHAETPRGAVPVVAVIDLCIEAPWPHGRKVRRRAIAVRPNFLRPAHLQRSVFFGSAGTKESDQHQDALRVQRIAAGTFGDRRQLAAPSVESSSLLESALRVTEAVAYCNFHRLWLGPYTASNITMDGQVVDFGSFTAVSSWRQFYGDAVRLPLGHELSQIIGCFLVARRTLTKNSIRVAPADKLASSITWRFRRVFEEECARLEQGAGLVGAETEVGLHCALRELYDGEQRETEYASNRRESLEQLLPLFRPDAGDESPAMNAYRAILDRLDATAATKLEDLAPRQLSALCLLARTFQPRRLLYREVLEPRTERLVSGRLSRRDDFDAIVARFIATTVLRSRRIWNGLPPGIVVLAQHSDGLSEYVMCIDPKSGESFVWLDLFCWMNRVHLFCGTVFQDDMTSVGQGSRWRFRVQIEDAVSALEAEEFDVAWRGGSMTLPRPRHIYRYASTIARQLTRTARCESG